MNESLDSYTFFWKDGKRTMSQGTSIADAFTRAGYGAGAVSALDFYSPGDNKEYIYDRVMRNWVRKDADQPSPGAYI